MIRMIHARWPGLPALITVAPVLLLTPACGGDADAGPPGELSDAQVTELVEMAYPFVAMYNVNNKFAMGQGGWNTVQADTQLKDHTLTDIARPNNDTFYTFALLDLTRGPVILDMPAFDSEYASLMITGYDHFVNVPLSTRLDDFEEPTRMLIYSERSPGYGGEEVEGIDEYFEATGDFVSAVIRVMPHAAEPDRMARIVEQSQQVRIETWAEFQGEPTPTPGEVEMPPVGATDLDIFEDNLLEVLQFAFDHTTFDPDDPNDQALLAAWAPLGVVPGQGYDPDRVAEIDGARFRASADEVRLKWVGMLQDPAMAEAIRPRQFQPKGETDPEAVLAVSVVGPIGIPQEEAVYPQVLTSDRQPLNALHDYVIRIEPEDMPPAGAFWSLTLYDEENGFFIPNDRKKYSVGLNGGMELDDDGGIDIWIAAEQPEGVPEANWLPIERKDLNLSVQMRLYEPDLEAYEDWAPPIAERVGDG